MEGTQDTSDMSFEFTGPAIVTHNPFRRSPKRDFEAFSTEDPYYKPAEQDARSAIDGNTTQQSSDINDYDHEQQEPQRYSPWLQWGILRAAQAVHFTGFLLQAAYAATLVAVVPVAAAKRRITSFAYETHAPAPVRRLLWPRHPTPRIFRQEASTSPGRSSTTPITSPRSRHSSTSPFHIPGKYPVSPVVPPIESPFFLSNTPATSTVNFHVDSTFLLDKADVDAVISPSVSSVDDLMNTEYDLLSPEYDTFDDTISAVHDSVSPTKDSVSPPISNTTKLASVNQLQVIQDTYQVDSVLYPPEEQKYPYLAHYLPDLVVNTTGRQRDALIKSSRSPSAKTAQQTTQLTSQYAGSIESTRSPMTEVTKVAGQLTSKSAKSTNSIKSPVSGQLTSESAKSTKSTQSPVVQKTGQLTSESAGSIESTRSPVAQTAGQLTLESAGLIESTRSPVAPTTGRPTSQTSEQIEAATSSLIELTQDTGRQADESIESTRSLSTELAQETRQLPSESAGLIDPPRSPEAQQEQPITPLRSSMARTHEMAVTTPVIPSQNRIAKLFRQLGYTERGKLRSSPLREAFNSANARRSSTKTLKNARFNTNPVTGTKKYVKGETISYPSPISSRNEDSLLSQISSPLGLSVSPTQQEQDAMIVDQLVSSTPKVVTYGIEAGPFEQGIALDLSVGVDDENPGKTYSDSSNGPASSQTSLTEDKASGQVDAPPTKVETLNPKTPQRDISNVFKNLSVSARRSSRRTLEKKELADKRRLELEAVAAKEKARKEQEEAEDRARKEQAEAEEKARKQAEEEEERKKSGRRMPIENVIQPLTEEWERKVAAALNKKQDIRVAYTSTRNPITRRDIGKVLPQRGTADDPSGWLNDVIIEAYLQSVVDHSHEVSGHQRGETPKIHAFNSFFYKNLSEGGVEKVKRWAKKAKIGGKDLEKVDWVFIPVNSNSNHWTLLAVSPTRKTIEYFDSLHGKIGDRIRIVKAWLKSELGSSYKDEEWRVIEDPALPPASGKGPYQANMSDCGMFTVTTAKMISLGVDPMAVNPGDMRTQRRRLVAELLNGGFKGDFEPSIKFE